VCALQLMFRYPLRSGPWRGAQPPWPARSFGAFERVLACAAPWHSPASAGAACPYGAALRKFWLPAEPGPCSTAFLVARLIEARSHEPPPLLVRPLPRRRNWPRSTATCWLARPHFGSLVLCERRGRDRRDRAARAAGG